ncbi:MAG: TetR family transcriptional regulator [Rubritepida sp.]|nr:TetR family transcriptional regulator [Rubritepida sp.]
MASRQPSDTLRETGGIRDPEAARARILAAATAEFAAHGFAGARMDRIGQSATVAKGLLFHHFGNKEGLYRAVLERIYGALRRRQDECRLTRLGPVEGMRRLVVDTFRGFREMPEITALMNEENLHRGRHLREVAGVPMLYDTLFEAMEGLLKDGRDQGVFRGDVDPIGLYVAMSGLGYFYCANRWTLSAAFAGDLFQPERIADYEVLVGDMIIAYLRVKE